MTLETRNAGATGYDPRHSATNPNSTRRNGISASIVATIKAFPTIADAIEVLRKAYLSQISSSTGRFPCKPDRYAVVVSMPKVNFVPFTKEETLKHVAELQAMELNAKTEDDANDGENSPESNSMPSESADASDSTNATNANAQTTPATNGANTPPTRAVPTYYTRLVQVFVNEDGEYEKGENLSDEGKQEFAVYEDVSVSVVWATMHLCNIKNTDVNSTAAMLALSDNGFTLEDKGVPFVPVKPIRAHPNAAVETSKRGVDATNVPEPKNSTPANSEPEQAPMRSSRRTQNAEPVAA